MPSGQIEILNAVFTPMFPDGSINYDRIPDLFEHCIQTGAQGVFLNGSTGECMSLSMSERLRLVGSWVAYRRRINRGDFKIFVHVGSCNLNEAAEMAAHAQAMGADGVAMVATFYFRPKTLEDLVEQCEYVAGAAPETPFYYYNIPSLTGVDFPLISFMELAANRIRNFAGLKNSFTDLADYQHCLHFAKENYAVYWGDDETFMTLYKAGNRHYVGSTYNYMSGLYHNLLRAHCASDRDAVIALEEEVESIYRIMAPYPGISLGKAIMSFIGVDCGPVRRPLKAIGRAESEELFRKLKGTIFFKQTVQTNGVRRVGA